MQQFLDTVIQTGTAGVPAVGCTLTVYIAGTNTLAALYNANNGTLIPNPVTANAQGIATFYAASGRYDILYSWMGNTLWKRDQLLFDPLDAQSFAVNGGSINNTPIGNATPSTAVFSSLKDTALTTHGVVLGNNPFTTAAPSTAGYLLMDNGAGNDPAFLGFQNPLTGSIMRSWISKASDFYTVKDPGAAGNTIAITSTVSITSGQAVLTCTGTAFTAADVGKSLVVGGAGAAGVPLTATIASVQSATQVTLSANAGTTLAASSQPLVYGTDDYPAINAALNSGATAVNLPVANYYLSQGLIIPAGVTLYSHGFLACNPPLGTVLYFGNAVATCIQLGGATGNNNASGAYGMTVTRACFISTTHTSNVPANTVGVLVQNQYNPTLHDLNIVGHAIPLSFLSNAVAAGISYRMHRVFTGGATDVHCQVTTSPEIYMSNCRFGINGFGDFACNGYMRVTGGVTTAGGPNTLLCVNTHFNQGGGVSPAYWLRFENMNAGYTSNTSEFSFVNCHVEALTTGYVYTDSTFNTLSRLRLTSTVLNTPVEFWTLNNATSVAQCGFSNTFFAGSYTLNSPNLINHISVSNCEFIGNYSVTGAGASVYNAAANTYFGNCTYGGVFAYVGDVGSSCVGTLTDNTTMSALLKNFSINGKSLDYAWTPVLNIGGATTGITYGTQAAVSKIANGVVTGQFNCTMTSIGALSGVVTITGLPVAPLKTTVFPLFYSGCASASSGLYGWIQGGSTTINIALPGATGTTQATQANLTATASLVGTYSYIAQ